MKIQGKVSSIVVHNQDFFSLLDQHLAVSDFKVNTYSPVALAYIGDCVYELIIRTVIMNQGAKSVNKMHRQARDYVNANRQAELFYLIEDQLTEEEMRIFKSGRNAKSGSSPKNASMKTYKHSTGFEAVLGYLYLNKDWNRIMELLGLGLKLLEEGQATEADKNQ